MKMQDEYTLGKQDDFGIECNDEGVEQSEAMTDPHFIDLCNSLELYAVPEPAPPIVIYPTVSYEDELIYFTDDLPF